MNSRLLLLVMAFSGLTAMAQMRMIPHVTRVGGGFTTQIQIENTAAVTKAVTITPYDSEGNALSVHRQDLNGLQTLTADVTSFFVEGEAVSHFSFEADAEVRVSVAYDFAGENGSPAHVASSDEEASIWRLFPGDWNNVFDGLAIVNTGAVATDVWITQKTLSGQIIKADRVASSLAPNAKALYVIGSPTDEKFSRDQESYFELSANQRVSITALRGTLADAPVGLLWANNARALGQSELKRDDKGVWFITDGSLYDVIEMQAYAVAEDRLWQLELSKRQGTGRFSEIFGGITINNDLLARETMYSPEELDTYYAATDEETKIIMQAYRAGLNRRIAQVNADSELLPFEFRRIGMFQVEEWSLHDLMQWISFVQRSFSMESYGVRQIQNGVTALDLVTRADGDFNEASLRFDDLRWTNDGLTPTFVHRRSPQKTTSTENKRHEWKLNPAIKNFDKIREFTNQAVNRIEEADRQLIRLGAKQKMGSYGWVVNGSKTASGNPILFAGPQVVFFAPVPVMEGSIVSDSLTVSGMTVPGLPGIAMGRTPHHAWAQEVGHAHTWDYYLEQPEDVFLHRKEIIEVAASNPIEFWVYRSQHGPIMLRSNLGELQPDEVLYAWKYAHWGYEFDLAKGLLGLARAESVDEFGDALTHVGISQHYLYADRNDNIAYWLSGRVPARPDSIYRFPQGMLLETVEYDIDVVEPLVHERNPPEGWFGGWNNQASADVGDPTATYAFGPFHRAHVIQDYLAAGDNFTVEDFKEFEFQIATTTNFHAGGYQWPLMRDVMGFADIVAANPTPERQAIIDELEVWDGHFPINPEGWLTSLDYNDAFVIQRQWLVRTIDMVFDDELTFLDNVFQAQQRLGTMLHAMMPEAGVTNNYDWFVDQNPENPQTFEEWALWVLDERLGVMTRPFSDWAGGRGINSYDHFLIGRVHFIPFFNRSMYTQVIEFDEQGPMRIESILGLGQSGTLYAGENGQPVTAKGNPVGNGAPAVYDDPFFGMSEFYDKFELRPFPLFPRDDNQ